MVNESGEVKKFLSQQALFQHLSESDVDALCANTFTSFAKSGTQLIPHNETEPLAPGLIMVRTGSIEIRNTNGVLLDRLSAGDFLIPEAVFKQNPAENYSVTVLEDCLYYELEKKAFKNLRKLDRDIEFLCESYTRRFTTENNPQSVSLRHSLRESYLDQSVLDYMSSPVVCAPPNFTIRQAAQLMKEKKISSLLVTEYDQLIGIMTDRDLRIRVLAEGVSDQEPISSIMTTNPICIGTNKKLHQAQLMMMSSSIHHLPIIENQKPIGLIGVSDIMRANNLEPVSLVRAIHNGRSVTELSNISTQFPSLVASLIERETPAVSIGEIITSLTDALTRRLLILAQEDFGPAPCEFSWLAFGSQARQEQVIGSDQDNAIIVEDGALPEHANYFRQLTEFVNLGLHSCGVVLCPGDVMARNPKWRLTLAEWQACFAHWIEHPTPKALMHASIFFDMRHIAGNETYTETLRQYVLSKAKLNTIFLALMSENALKHSPPLGFFKTFVLEKDGDHNRTLDLKKRGTIPIVDIARNYCLGAGLNPVSTVSRLEAIEEQGLMSKALASSLLDALEFISEIRLEAQGAKYRSGSNVDNQLDPNTLSPLVRHQLKDAFHLVRQAQSAMKVRFSGGLI
ncbi:DUF294 nucleotidyltransferase-like domain-containing protein [Teredinibacter sp. KSP-S5-2]|uniref:DUF294 nucleotidyltransferase-like domain-containing protein n=1 Tax=Teredinibacter sp. KSP-S5-2 TaxID=3034506 RepID=UPI002935207D|nr:DUF294 nucleotidyltransferase-like domain-containing protein [Teredinibacter sp. KSP-S5-2]WNO11101.1 DUF294 nucleotidyltransferase-like domain-containing protein [Teredinibacter sp. KSP-S5-2]